MNPDPDSPDSLRTGPEKNDSGIDPTTPGAEVSSRLLANHRLLLDRLFAEASAYSWSVTRQNFQAALERTITRRFGSAVVPTEKLDEYLSALHLRDLSLAAACSAGDSAAWEYFVATYRPYLRSAASAILRCSATSPAARDLADSLFADLYGLTDAKRSDRSLFRYFHGRSSLKTWLRAVLAQRHIDAIRANRRLTDLADDESDSGRFERRLAKDSTASTREQSPPDPHRRRYVTLFTRTLQVALGLLDPNDRERLRLYYAEAQTLAQIGRKLGEHESSVSRNLDRIRRQLRSEVETALRDPRVATNGANPEPGLSEEQIAQCFEYAAEDAPIDLDQLLPSNDQKPERLDP
jgi:RNA polymerase sigma factor (sigma-70 family)